MKHLYYLSSCLLRHHHHRCLPFIRFQVASVSSETKEEPKLWEDPFYHAKKDIGAIDPNEKYTKVETVDIDWSYVQRLLPHKIIPEVPAHSTYPTPSGWQPPRDPPPNLPYRIHRTRYHGFPLNLRTRRDRLDIDTMEFDYVATVVLNQVVGDVFVCDSPDSINRAAQACERDLRQYCEEKVGSAIGTHVNELQGKITVKGVERPILEQWLTERGF